MNPSQYQIRGKLGALVKHRPHDTEAADCLRRDLKVSRTEDTLRDLVTTPPTPTIEQRSHLAAILLSEPSR